MEKFDWSKAEFARTPWRSQVIPDALPILIRWAQEGEAHSYSDLAQELHDTFGHEIKPRKDLYGTVAGGVAQALEWLSDQWEEPIPPLRSGDRLDAHFDNGRHRLAVEVKTSKCSEDELQRGVYQAVKYRAIVRAEQKAVRHVPNGEAVLVCTRSPNAETRALIKRLQVRFQQAPLEAEKP